MNNSINKLSGHKKLEDIIKEQSLLIFDEKNWIEKELWKISEVTYSYNKETNVNTTLFVSGGGLDIEEYKKSDKKIKKSLILKSKSKLEKLLKEKIDQIDSALGEVELFDAFSKSNIDIDVKSIFINSLEEKKKFLEYALLALPFEIEKSGFKSGLTTEQEKEIEEKIKKIDKELFGGDIKDNPKELVISYEVYIEKFNNNIDNLTKEEQKRIKFYLSKVEKLLPKAYQYKQKEKPKQVDGDFLNIDLPKHDYILGFNILIEALEKLEHVVESNENVGSISDGPKGVQFPTTEKFSKMNVLRFFKLSNHEIETHNITDYNSRQLLGNLRGAKSTEKDEGLAMLMEQLLIYGNELLKTDERGNKIIDIDKIQINSYFLKTLMGEILDDNELKEFLELSEKVDPDVITPIDRFYRLKRNNKKGVQHKDTTYTRGLLKAIEEINKYIVSKGKEGISLEDLFLGKISFEETSKLKRVKENKIKSGEDIEIIKPLFISDAIYFIINGFYSKGEKPRIDGEEYYNFLIKKYPVFKFSKYEIKETSQNAKKNIYGIANILIKNIDINNLEKIDKKNTGAKESVSRNFKYKIKKVKEKMHHDRKNAR